jgi:solute carrier family 10 (sodium/bile acid cotransporter), member 7
VFAKTFLHEQGTSIGHILLMVLYQFLLMVGLAAIAWYALAFLFRDEPELRVTGMMACVMKTAALGIPIITSMYNDDPKLGLYTLPILIWYPMEIILATMMAPVFTAFVTNERVRLNKNDQESDTQITDVEAPHSDDSQSGLHTRDNHDVDNISTSP